jgi:hypothetical protein
LESGGGGGHVVVAKEEAVATAGEADAGAEVGVVAETFGAAVVAEGEIGLFEKGDDFGVAAIVGGAVGDADFEIGEGLPAKGGEHFKEKRGAVVLRDADGEEGCGGRVKGGERVRRVE